MFKVPGEFQAFMPSVHVDKLDTAQDKELIIESLLKQASLDAWKWMFSVYGEGEIIEVIKNPQNLRKKMLCYGSTTLI